jgi:hypothetical protein
MTFSLKPLVAACAAVGPRTLRVPARFASTSTRNTTTVTRRRKSSRMRAFARRSPRAPSVPCARTPLPPSPLLAGAHDVARAPVAKQRQRGATARAPLASASAGLCSLSLSFLPLCCRLCACTCNDAKTWQATPANEDGIRRKRQRMDELNKTSDKFRDSPQHVRMLLSGADQAMLASIDPAILRRHGAESLVRSAVRAPEACGPIFPSCRAMTALARRRRRPRVSWPRRQQRRPW